MKPESQNYPIGTIHVILLALLCSLSLTPGMAQHFTSINNGSWTTGSTWVGGAVPPTGGTWGSVTIKHNVTLSGNYITGSSSLTVEANKTLTITGNFTTQGGATINVYGTLILEGSANISSNLYIHPGGQVIIKQNITVNDSQYLNVGTNVNAPPYADLVVYGNLVSNNSGDVTVNRNGRVAVFGDMTSNGGGTLLTVNNGGQVYIHGDLNFSGGTGNHVQNNNTTSPYGLYVNGSTTAQTGQGSTITPNRGDQDTMENTNPPFFNWVSGIPFGPLPVTWLSFAARNLDNKSVHLSWSTASEVNAESFIIERSMNGKTYLPAGSVPASGNSRVRKDYSFTDAHPYTGRTYYRLRQVDYDGTYSYSDIRFADVDRGRSVSVFPNPLEKGELNLALNFSEEEEVFVSVYDVTGHKIDQFSFFGPAFTKPLNLKAGTYMLRANAGRENLVCRFVVN